MAVIEPGVIIVAHSLLFFLLTKMSIMEVDGPSTCPSPWPDIRVQGVPRACTILHMCSLSFPAAFIHPFNQWRHMAFGEDRLKWHI